MVFLPVAALHALASAVVPGNLGIIRTQLFMHVTFKEQVMETTAQCGEISGESLLLTLVNADGIPVHPADVIVLAIGIVIAAQRATELVTSQQHRRALGEQQRAKKILLLAQAQHIDSGVARRAFDAEIVAIILAMAVLIFLAIDLVVPFTVADQIIEREAVVTGHKIDARGRTTSVAFENIAGTMQAPRELGQHAGITAPEAAHGVTIAIVPFTPTGRKAPQLIASRADVPRLRNQLDARQRRVLLHGVEEAAALIEAVRLPPEHGREIEPKAIDLHGDRPVAQTVHDQLHHARVHQIKRIAAACVIDVKALILRLQPVIGQIVDTTEGQ